MPDLVGIAFLSCCSLCVQPWRVQAKFLLMDFLLKWTPRLHYMMSSHYDRDSVSVKCFSSEKGQRYEATLDNTVGQIVEFGRK